MCDKVVCGCIVCVTKLYDEAEDAEEAEVELPGGRISKNKNPTQFCGQKSNLGSCQVSFLSVTHFLALHYQQKTIGEHGSW